MLAMFLEEKRGDFDTQILGDVQKSYWESLVRHIWVIVEPRLKKSNGRFDQRKSRFLAVF